MKGKELELEGWRAWKAEGIKRYWEGGNGGFWHGVRDPGWLRVDYAAWKVHWAKTQRDWEGKEGEKGAAEAGTGAGPEEIQSREVQQVVVPSECRLAVQRREAEELTELIERERFRREG